MAVVRDWFWRIVRWEHFFLLLILLVTLGMHAVIINNPTDTVLDEIHYVKDARKIISENMTERQEHPPLGKLFVVGGVEMLGDNAYGWRIFPIICGTAMIIFFYFLCRNLGMSKTATNIATFLLAFENMTFTHASITMLDIYYVTFMVLAFMLYAGKRYISSGVAIGLAGLSKLQGAMAAPVVGIHWLFSRKQGHTKWFILTALFSVIVFVEIGMLLDFAIVKEFSNFINPVKRIQDMLSLSGSLTFENVEHPALTRPWEWLLKYTPMAYYISPIHYNGAISFSTWALAIPTFIYTVILWIKRKSEAALFAAAWFFGTWVLWIPASYITDRSSYPYYFLPTVGAICLGMGIGLARLIEIFKSRERGKVKWTCFAAVVLILLVHVGSFVILSPVFNFDYSWFIQMIA